MCGARGPCSHALLKTAHPSGLLPNGSRKILTEVCFEGSLKDPDRGLFLKDPDRGSLRGGVRFGWPGQPKLAVLVGFGAKRGQNGTLHKGAAGRIACKIRRSYGAENASADEAGSERRRGGRFGGARRLQVVVGELGSAVDRDGAGVRLD